MTYLGSVPVDVKDTDAKDYTPWDWARTFIESFGGIDGNHHKRWVLDQVCRIMHGTPVLIELHRWDDHPPEYRFSTGESSQAYLDWVNTQCGNYDPETEEYEYKYDAGIAP